MSLAFTKAGDSSLLMPLSLTLVIFPGSSRDLPEFSPKFTRKQARWSI